MNDLNSRLYWRKRYITDFELVECDWRTSDTGEKKLQDILNKELESWEYWEFDMSDSTFGGCSDLTKKEDELRFKVVFIDKYTMTKYTVECGFYAGFEVEWETDNTSYISKWDTPEDPTELGWDEDIEYNLDGAYGSKYYEDAENDNITDKTPQYSILSMTAEACEGSKYSPDFFNEMTDKEKESHLAELKIRDYGKTTMLRQKIMDYYFYNLIRYNRHVEV